MDGNALRSKSPRPGRPKVTLALAALVTAMVVAGLLLAPLRAYGAIVPTINLGTAANFSVLAGQSVTNVGNTVLTDDVGVSSGTSITGFPPGITLGTIYEGGAPAVTQAQFDATAAYTDAKSRVISDPATTFDLTGTDLGSATPRIAGVYGFTGAAQLTGTLILDGGNNPLSVFIFKIGESLTTATSSRVVLTNGASACNVFFQVEEDATLGTNTTFVGNVLAENSIFVGTGTTIQGRALAQVGSVTLDNNAITSPICPAAVPPVTVTATETEAGPTVTTTEAGVTVTTTEAGVTVTTTEAGATVTTTEAGATATETETATQTATATQTETVALQTVTTGPTRTTTAAGPTVTLTSDGRTVTTGPTRTVTATSVPTTTDTEQATEAPTVTTTATATATVTSTRTVDSSRSPTTTQSSLSTNSELATELATEGDNDDTGSGDNLADTGASGMSNAFGIAGALLLIVGLTVLAAGRARMRPKRRH